MDGFSGGRIKRGFVDQRRLELELELELQAWRSRILHVVLGLEPSS